MLEQLSKLLRSIDVVEEAYFGQIYVPSRKDPPHLVIQLKLSKGLENRFDEIASPSANIAKNYLASREPFDIGGCY
jgi:hypothetical protein